MAVEFIVESQNPVKSAKPDLGACSPDRVITVALSAKVSGKSVRDVGFGGATLHILRHTFSTRLKNAGVDPTFTIRDLIGHAHIHMDYYTHATHETMRRGHEALKSVTTCPKIVPSVARQSA
jgi:integrase